VQYLAALVDMNPKKPLVPLTKVQQRNIAREEFTKAKTQLSEAVSIRTLGKAPGATVSTAYYAFEHAACAAILLLGGVGVKGDFPKNHRDIGLHIGLLTAADTELANLGMLLMQVYTLREYADYSLQRHPSREEAEFAVQCASDFIAACLRKWKSEIDPEYDIN
jgi:uncharacterized protein (UPF0332 family)